MAFFERGCTFWCFPGYRSRRGVVVAPLLGLRWSPFDEVCGRLDVLDVWEGGRARLFEFFRGIQFSGLSKK